MWIISRQVDYFSPSPDFYFMMNERGLSRVYGRHIPKGRRTPLLTQPACSHGQLSPSKWDYVTFKKEKITQSDSYTRKKVEILSKHKQTDGRTAFCSAHSQVLVELLASCGTDNMTRLLVLLLQYFFIFFAPSRRMWQQMALVSLKSYTVWLQEITKSYSGKKKKKKMTWTS